MKISLLINMKMPTTVGIFIFISRENFMLSSAEHEKSFITWARCSVHQQSHNSTFFVFCWVFFSAKKYLHFSYFYMKTYAVGTH